MWARRNTRVSLGRVPGCRSWPAAGPSGSRPRAAGPRSPGASRTSRDATASSSPRSVRQTSRSWPGVVRTSDHLGGDRPVVGDRQRRPPEGERGSVRQAGGQQEPRRRRHRRGRGRSRGTAPSPRRPGARQTSAIGPACTMRPARITARSSATANASSWSWVTITAVVPASTRIRRRSSASRCAQSGVERAQRLVEQQQPRGGGQGAGESDPLALTTGQGRRQPLGEAGQADQVEQLGDPGGQSRRAAYAGCASG